MSLHTLLRMRKLALVLVCFSWPGSSDEGSRSTQMPHGVTFTSKSLAKPRHLQSNRQAGLPQTLRSLTTLLTCHSSTACWYAPGHTAHALRKRHLDPKMQFGWKSRHRFYEKRPGDWACKECGATDNYADRKECHNCGAPRPGRDEAESEEVEQLAPGNAYRRIEYVVEGQWDCHQCGAKKNLAHRTQCYKCGAPKPGTGVKESVAVIVENLSESTDSTTLRDAFVNEGYPVVQAKISMARYTGKSKGKGVVEFETKHAAKHAIEEMTGFELDGRSIKVRPDPKDVLEARLAKERMLGVRPMNLERRPAGAPTWQEQWEMEMVAADRAKEREEARAREEEAQESEPEEEEEEETWAAELDELDSLVSSSLWEWKYPKSGKREWEVRKEDQVFKEDSEADMEAKEKEEEEARLKRHLSPWEQRRKEWWASAGPKIKRRQELGLPLKYDWKAEARHKHMDWTRVPGSLDGSVDDTVDVKEVDKLLQERDAARLAQNYERADRILHQLAHMQVSFDDHIRHREWWIGVRADGHRVGGRGAAELRARGMNDMKERWIQESNRKAEFDANLAAWKDDQEAKKSAADEESRESEAERKQGMRLKSKTGWNEVDDEDWFDEEDDPEDMNDENLAEGIKRQEIPKPWLDEEEEDDDWEGDAEDFDPGAEDEWDEEDLAEFEKMERSMKGPPKKQVRGSSKKTY
mmetsp:Transcript_126497/g.236478  ORF Transcript_126497/g.236478 Transcript_126497/m.236478 type:complete len:695 (+) Transcript_126497:47-2131(+)